MKFENTPFSLRRKIIYRVVVYLEFETFREWKTRILASVWKKIHTFMKVSLATFPKLLEVVISRTGAEKTLKCKTTAIQIFWDILQSGRGNIFIEATGYVFILPEKLREWQRPLLSFFSIVAFLLRNGIQIRPQFQNEGTILFRGKRYSPEQVVQLLEEEKGLKGVY